jgi:two-component system cell cycle response regulator
MPNARILIADDDAATLETVSWVLKEHGYDVSSAREGTRLIDLLEAGAPDLVLLDVMFPDADGYQLLERIKSDERWRDVPVMMVSSLPPEEAAVRALGLGAADFVRKPFRVKELLARIQAQLRMRSILRSANDALHVAERELERVREEAESRRKLVDILHDVSDDLSSDEIYHLLARRVARALDLTHCAVILARAGERPRVVATAFEHSAADGLELELERYPEIRAALESGRPVLVEDVRKSPLYAEAREQWQREGHNVDIRSIIALPFALEPTQAGVFFLRRNLSEPPLTHDDLEFADTVVKAAVTAVHRAQALEMTKADNRRLEQLALTDPLTKVLNRRALTERLAAEVGRVNRYESMVSLMLIDLDHFKNVNDNYGHLVGDDVLTEMAALLQGAIRAVDVVARYGGEEFVVVLPETGAAGAAAFAERLRELVELHPFTRGTEGTLHLTASIGVASYPAPGIDSAEDLLASADQALYRAKADGRNRVRGMEAQRGG